MKRKKKKSIIVSKNDTVLFDGLLIEMPIKEEYVIKRSVELFDDEDPCIIHKSYVIKDYSDMIISLFKDNNTNILKGEDHIEKFNMVDFTDIDNITFELKE